MKLISLLALTIVLTEPLLLAEPANIATGSPYGPITEHDVEAFAAFSKNRGLDVVAEMEKVYSKNDETALARVFGFSMQFGRLDKNARVYGWIIWCSLLNFGDSRGENYARVVSTQDPKVQQRIRDFIYFVFTQAPIADRLEFERESRKQGLFSPGYVFGRGNPLFEKKD